MYYLYRAACLLNVGTITENYYLGWVKLLLF